MEYEIIFINCSVPKGVFNTTDGIVENETTNTFDRGIIADIAMVALVFNVILSATSFVKKSSLSTELFDNKILLRTLVLIVFVAMLPMFLVLLIFFMCYKFICSVIIKRKDKDFVSFLDSFDVFWFLEGDSVINILGVIESDSPEALVENVKLKLQNLINNKTSDKIFYRRNEEYGFYYWRQNNSIDVSEYVEILELPDKCELSEKDLEDVMAEVSSESLPYDDEGLFKILITKQRVTNHENGKEEYGIIFRIHHSVGDGVALINFLCESLADNNNHSTYNKFSMSEFSNNGTPDDLIKMIRKLCDIPFCIVDVILRKPDENSLHGPSLLGMQHFRWTESDENLLIMVKEIKENVELNFLDIIATALASGLNNYFNKTMAHVPEDVAVIIPIRLPLSSSIEMDHNRFSNDFSISTFDLPVKEHRNLSKLKSRFADLRLSNEYLANHLIVKLASVFPKNLLKPIFYSSQATVTLSNMPGPDLLSICGGNILRKMVFFLPLKGSTGVGVSAFCYGGVLRLAVSADAAVVPNADDLDFILEGMVDEIKQMHGQYAN